MAPQPMDRIVEAGNLTRALTRAPESRQSGVDGRTVDELPAYLREHWPALREQLLIGTYQPSVINCALRVTGRRSSFPPNPVAGP
jgi:RNA-directed DNA polymerase